jgi:uncharacterized membrane protein
MSKLLNVKRASLLLLIALIALCTLWEIWLSPVRPGGSWLAFKALPLLACVMSIAKGERRTFQIVSLLVWLYVLEGATRLLGEHGLARWLCVSEIALATALFAAVAAYAKWTRVPKASADA